MFQSERSFIQYESLMTIYQLNCRYLPVCSNLWIKTEHVYYMKKVVILSEKGGGIAIFSHYFSLGEVSYRKEVMSNKSADI